MLVRGSKFNAGKIIQYNVLSAPKIEVLCLHFGQELWHTVDYGDIIANRGLPTQLAV
jgi:hypothetical protein